MMTKCCALYRVRCCRLLLKCDGKRTENRFRLSAKRTSPFKPAGASRLLWSRSSVLAFGTQVREFKPGRNRRIIQGEKILSTPSFGGEVKPTVPCRRFTACKRFLNATWKSGISGTIHRPFLAHILPPLATRISGETTSGESWNV